MQPTQNPQSGNNVTPPQQPNSSSSPGAPPQVNQNAPQNQSPAQPPGSSGPAGQEGGVLNVTHPEPSQPIDSNEASPVVNQQPGVVQPASPSSQPTNPPQSTEQFSTQANAQPATMPDDSQPFAGGAQPLSQTPQPSPEANNPSVVQPQAAPAAPPISQQPAPAPAPSDTTGQPPAITQPQAAPLSPQQQSAMPSSQPQQPAQGQALGFQQQNQPQVTANQPTQEQSAPMQPADIGQPKKNSPKKPLIIGAAVLAAITLFSVAVFMMPRLFSASIEYSETVTTSTSNESGENIMVSHPAEMEEIFVSAEGMELRHKGEDGRGFITELFASSIFIGTTGMEAAIEEFTGELQNQDSVMYESIVDESQSDEYRNFEISEFALFDDHHESVQKSLVADLSFDVPYVDDAEEYVSAKGQFIVVFGQERVYVVAVAALEDVWNNNRHIFEELPRGIKVEM